MKHTDKIKEKIDNAKSEDFDKVSGGRLLPL